MKALKKDLSSQDFSPDVPGIANELRAQLQRYIEAQYPIRHPEVIAERHALLETAGVIAQEPFIESMPGYQPGPAYCDLALPTLITQALSEMVSWSPSFLPTRLYQHQAEALEAFLKQDRDLIVVTGTGSGKTETFLLPILSRSILEACTHPTSFRQPGMRALLLYPMNALVNDQITRLRQIFSHPNLINWFRLQTQVNRPVRFGMYTSRTPYPGLMSKEKHKRQLHELLQYYTQLEIDQKEQADELKRRGRWPALDMVALDLAASEGNVSLTENDIELFTRHQIQQWCPDILVTNYSMLEYMLMRPIEQTIFQQTASWLAQDPANTLLIVLDEAHLYNGVTGAEIALLLRRLHARLGINRSRVRYILTSASLDLGKNSFDSVLDFAQHLVSTRSPDTTFAIIQGKRLAPPTAGSVRENALPQEAVAFAQFDLRTFANRVEDPEAALAAIAGLAAELHWPEQPTIENLPFYLGEQLPTLQTFQQLWKITASNATSFQDLAQQLFPHLNEKARGTPTSALLSLSATASTSDGRPLLPVRAHLFFRGLPPIYACINPRCHAKKADSDSLGPLGALWLSPRLHCECGARVYELYAHRNCGTLFLRVFSSAEQAEFYWHEPGQEKGQSIETFLLVGKPHPKAKDYEEIDLHIMTGQTSSAELIKRNPFRKRQEEDFLRVSRPRLASNNESSTNKRKKALSADDKGPHWKSCPVCRKRLNAYSITSLSTKGEQPFVNLVRRQFELQPPSKALQEAAPNMGRKVLLFSDGRQRAARLARDLPREVELDTLRQALVLAVSQRGKQTGDDVICIDQALYNEFIRICAYYHLYFFDGESQKDLLNHIQEFHENGIPDIEQALDDDWEPSLSQGYRLALLRQVADPFYSMQRMCVAVVEPRPTSLKRLRNKPIFAHLTEQQLHALTIYWIEELLAESAFDASIPPYDREKIVPGAGFEYNSTSWNDAEKAAETLLGYPADKLASIRRAFVDELCDKSSERAFLTPKKLAIRLTLHDPWYQCQDCTRLVWHPLNNQCPNPHCGSTCLVQLPGTDPGLRARTDFYREPIRQMLEHKHVPRHLTAEEHTAQLSYRDIQQALATTEEYEQRFQDMSISTDRPAIDVLSCTTTMEVGVDIGSLLGIGLRTMPPRRANYQQRAGRAGRRSAALSTVLTYSENGSHDAHYFSHPEEMISGPLPCPRISPINERLLRRHIQAALIQTFFLEQAPYKGSIGGQYGYLAEALGTASTFFTTTEPQSLTAFTQWLKKGLSGQNPPLLPQITAWLPTTMTDVKLQNDHFLHGIAETCIAKLQTLGKQLFPTTLSASEHTSAPKQSFDPDSEDMLLDILFEHDFLPTYAFPREVRSFVIETSKISKSGPARIRIEQRPQQSVDIALSEYAPGRELIVNKATYLIGGIYIDPFPGSTLATRVPSFFDRSCQTFACCLNCGYTVQIGPEEQKSQSGQPCPLCNTPLIVKEILDPPGYAPAKARSLEQNELRNDISRGGEMTSVQLVLPQNQKDTFNQSLADQRIAWSYTEHHQLLVMNTGSNKEGFSVCRSCGAAAPGNAVWLQQSHDRPFLVPPWMNAPRKCNASEGIWQGYLGHVFYSDLFILRLQWPAGVAYHLESPWTRDALDTLAQAFLLAITRLLDISTSELQAGWSYSIAAQRDIPSERVAYLFLFDTLSGGAGYATQARQHMAQLLKETQKILDECPDQCERSCYRCLCTYQNRFLHSHLDRKLAGTLLRAIISGRPPERFSLDQQIDTLSMLRHYLHLNGIRFRQSVNVQGVTVPLLVETRRQSVAIGVYPVQQDIQVVKHSLDALPNAQVRLLSNYELMHNLPHVACMLL